MVAKVGVRYSDETKDYVAQRFLSPIAFLGVPDELGPIAANTDDSEISWDLSVTRYFTEKPALTCVWPRASAHPASRGASCLVISCRLPTTEVSHSYEFGVKSDFNEGPGALPATFSTTPLMTSSLLLLVAAAISTAR